MTVQEQAQFVYGWASGHWDDDEAWYAFRALGDRSYTILFTEFVEYMTHDDWKIYGSY